MRKSSIAVTLVLLSPALLVAGCNNRDDEDDNEANNYSGARSYGSRAKGGSDAGSPRGGFGSIGRWFSGGG